MSIVRTRTIWYLLSVVLIALSVISIATFGLRLGIDFTGGALVTIAAEGGAPDAGAVQEALKKANIEVSQVQVAGTDELLIRTKFLSAEEHSRLLEVVKDVAGPKTIRENAFETIGPTISSELTRRAFWAIAGVVFAIIFYIAWAFRKVSAPIPSWQYGVIAVVALFHDVFIPLGIYAALGKFFGYEIDVLIVTGILTVLGFSVHDTIVTFDRIRENLLREARLSFSEIVDHSIRQTITRSINTSLTVLLILLAVFFLGGETIKHFILLLLMGIVVGTYSSIFIASPLLVTIYNFKRRKI